MSVQIIQISNPQLQVSNRLRLSALIDNGIELFVALLKILHHLVGNALFVNFPNAFFADKLHGVPDVVRILHFNSRPLAADFFVAKFDARLSFGKQSFAFNNFIER